MTIAQAYKAHDMHKDGETPRRVETQKDHDELAAAGWTKEYQHQEYPTTLYREVEQKDKAGNVIDPLIQQTIVQDAAHGLGPEWVPFAQLPSEIARVASAPPPIVKGSSVDGGVQTQETVAPALTKNVVKPKK